MQNATVQDESSSLQTTGYQFISALIAFLKRRRRDRSDEQSSRKFIFSVITALLYHAHI